LFREQEWQVFKGLAILVMMIKSKFYKLTAAAWAVIFVVRMAFVHPEPSVFRFALRTPQDG